MAADVNKSVEITLKANIKQLQKNLEQIPGMTKKEASAMVRALSSEFNKATRAAKKAAEESKKAAQITAKEYEKSSEKIKESFKQSADSAAVAAQEIKVSFEEAEDSTNALAESAEVVGTAFGAASLATEKLVPNLDEGAKKALEMADGLATAAEQAIKGGPITAALTVATVALTAAYSAATSSSRKHAAATKEYTKVAETAKNKNKELEDSFKSIADQTKSIDDQFADISERINEAALDLQVARGEMTEEEAESTKISFEAAKMQQEAANALDKQVELAKQFRKLKEEEARAAQDEAFAVLAAAKNMRKNSGERNAAMAKFAELQAKARRLNDDLFSSQRKFTEELEGFQALQETTLATARNAAKQYEEQQKALLKIRLQEEARARAAERLAKIQDIYNMVLSEQEQTEDRIQQRQMARLEGTDKINAEAEKELSIIKDRENVIIAESEKAIQIAKNRKESAKVAELEADAVRTIAQLDAERREVEKDRIQQIADLKSQTDEEERQRRAEIDKEEQERFENRIKQQKALTTLTLSSLSSITSDGLKLATESGEKNKDLINVLFRANQAASLANIAMKTAEAIAAAPAQFGALAPAAIAAIVASAGVQTGVVLSQKPPLHMGGVVAPLAPDEQSRTVLTGEAVLDRATVRRLGGEQGIQRLQEGSTMSPDVIVMNPFKHLDRYNRSAIRNRNSAFSRLQPTQRQKY